VAQSAPTKRDECRDQVKPASPPKAELGMGILEPPARPPLKVGESADCCCAVAQVRVVLPPNAGHAVRRELRLCAHRYRAAVVGLRKAGADVYDAHGRWLTGAEQCFADDVGSRGPMAQLPA
jgi:hypothetical protein